MESLRKRLKQEQVPEDFAVVIDGIRAFLQPVLSALNARARFDLRWDVVSGWR